MWVRWDGEIMSVNEQKRARHQTIHVSLCRDEKEKMGRETYKVVGRRRVLDKGTEDAVPPPACSITSSTTLFFLSFFVRRTGAHSVSGELKKTITRCRTLLFSGVFECELRDRDLRRNRRLWSRLVEV